mmetsp:Transcript_17265/g.51412  ORF Transcript_17265/g.51412 Transcript_17265/m.51412 type:complete len:366 (-) Transcript_17265:11-1108(-)
MVLAAALADVAAVVSAAALISVMACRSSLSSWSCCSSLAMASCRCASLASSRCEATSPCTSPGARQPSARKGHSAGRIAQGPATCASMSRRGRLSLQPSAHRTTLNSQLPSCAASYRALKRAVQPACEQPTGRKTQLVRWRSRSVEPSCSMSQPQCHSRVVSYRCTSCSARRWRPPCRYSPRTSSSRALPATLSAAFETKRPPNERRASSFSRRAWSTARPRGPFLAEESFSESSPRTSAIASLGCRPPCTTRVAIVLSSRALSSSRVSTSANSHSAGAEAGSLSQPPSSAGPTVLSLSSPPQLPGSDAFVETVASTAVSLAFAKESALSAGSTVLSLSSPPLPPAGSVFVETVGSAAAASLAIA